MQNSSRDVKNNYYLMLCELHYPGRHGKTDDSDPNIENHYLVYDRFDPISGISFCHLDEYDELDTDNEYESDDDMEERHLCNINNEMTFLKEMYSNPENFRPQYFGIHPTIRNYHNIISKPNYIKPEIGEKIYLPSGHCVCIIKTIWLKLVQRAWKKTYKNRINVIQKRCSIDSITTRLITGNWPENCRYLPNIRGILFGLSR